MATDHGRIQFEGTYYLRGERSSWGQIIACSELNEEEYYEYYIIEMDRTLPASPQKSFFLPLTNALLIVKHDGFPILMGQVHHGQG